MNKSEYEALIAEAKLHISLARGHASNAAVATWALADTLARVPVVNKSQQPHADAPSLGELARDVGMSASYVVQLRRAAKQFPVDKRIETIGPAVHLAVKSKFPRGDAALLEMRSRLAVGDVPRMYEYTGRKAPAPRRQPLLTVLTRARSTLATVLAQVEEDPSRIDQVALEAEVEALQTIVTKLERLAMEASRS